MLDPETKWFKYPSIKRMGDVEVKDILNMAEIWIEPKIDGANASIFIKDGIITCAKRSGELTSEDKGFRGLQSYIDVRQYEFTRFFEHHPRKILYGEWLVKHTIGYYEKEAYGHFYVFDIFCPDEDCFLRPDQRLEILSDLELKFIPVLKKFTGPIADGVLDSLLKENTFLIKEEGKIGEGLVIKGYDGTIPHTSVFGRPTWGKLVRPVFQEKCTKEFPKPDKGEYEQMFADLYVVQARVDKIKEKIGTDKGTGWTSKYIGELLGRVWNDVFTEELWDFVKANKVGAFDFKKAQRACMLETKKYLGI